MAAFLVLWFLFAPAADDNRGKGANWHSEGAKPGASHRKTFKSTRRARLSTDCVQRLDSSKREMREWHSRSFKYRVSGNLRVFAAVIR